MTGPIDNSQHRAARTAGIAYVLSFVLVVGVNFGIFGRLLVGDPGQIARAVIANATVFRIGLVGQLLYSVGVVVVSAALYIVLGPVDRLLALLAGVGRLVHAFTWLLVSLNLLTALRLLGQPDYAHALPPDQLAALARLDLSGFDQYYVGLLF